MSRIGSALADARESTAKVIRPQQFRINWLGLGLGLAAAATFLIFARVDFRPTDKTKQTVASATPFLQQEAAVLGQLRATRNWYRIGIQPATNHAAAATQSAGRTDSSGAAA